MKAQDAERRKIERNLHDGAQQQRPLSAPGGTTIIGWLPAPERAAAA